MLQELFEIPAGSSDSLNLADYIKDSIDVGELLAALKIRYSVTLEPNDFRKVHLLGEVWELIEGKQ